MTKRFKRDAGRRRRSGRRGSKPDSGDAEITIFVLEGIIFRLKGTLLLSPFMRGKRAFFLRGAKLRRGISCEKYVPFFVKFFEKKFFESLKKRLHFKARYDIVYRLSEV